MNDTASELRRKPLGIPSTFVALLERSKGEPRAVFEEAMKFRDDSKALRDELEKLAAKHPGDTSTSRDELRKKIRELGDAIVT